MCRFILAGGLALIAVTTHAFDLVVDTTENTIDGSDGKYTFTEALTDAKPGDTIKFNIAGPGPHFIRPPDAGFPVISVSALTIDGYSQSGSAPNTNSLAGPNTSKVQI